MRVKRTSRKKNVLIKTESINLHAGELPDSFKLRNSLRLSFLKANFRTVSAAKEIDAPHSLKNHHIEMVLSFLKLLLVIRIF
jgi:hypothetical protein